MINYIKKRIHKICVFKNLNSGFTIIELVVVISIFATMSSIVLFRFSDFSENISIQNLTQEIALTIHQAQNNAISGVFDERFLGKAPTYGVNFSMATPTQFTYFLDSSGNGMYNSDNICGSGSNECLDIIQITKNKNIYKVCVDEQTSKPDCTAEVKELSITFTRPFPNAIIKDNNGNIYSDAEIYVTSVKGIKREVVIWLTGQVSVIRP